jgi:hypothetical protein
MVVSLLLCSAIVKHFVIFRNSLNTRGLTGHSTQPLDNQQTITLIFFTKNVDFVSRYGYSRNMKVNMNAETLTRAATLATQIEALTVELTTATTKVDELTGKINPLQTELNTLVGTPRKACKVIGGTGRHFSAEVRAKISAGQKARWAARKASTVIDVLA